METEEWIERIGFGALQPWLGALGLMGAGCNLADSKTGEGAEKGEMRTSNFFLGPIDEVVDNPIPLGWGYNSDLATHIGGSCWDLSSNPEDYAVVQNMDFVTATHRWSSTKEEAISEIHAEMDADADFGMIEADFGAVYDATTTSTQSEAGYRRFVWVLAQLRVSRDMRGLNL